MWRITGKLEHNTAIVQVGLQRFLPQPMQVGGVSVPVPMVLAPYRALIDTGAEITGISERAINDNGLVSRARALVTTGHSKAMHKKYEFYLGFMCEFIPPGDSHPRPTVYGLPEPMSAIDIRDNDMFDVIIGMNILSRCDFSLRRSGDFTLEINTGAFSR